ncbi:MAG: 30S ribosomal protein S7, partial [Planctomycetes bacterium]|nr:30S ribosomal protein S7 [Planctomycetota bacterium]
MPRKYQSTERFLKPDPRYGSRLISKFVNSVMLDGKKSTAERVVYGALDLVAKRITDRPPEEVFNIAIQNLKPAIEVRSKRVGGATYQVPIEVNRRRQQNLAFRWMLDVVRKKKGRATERNLAEEILA